MGGGGEGVEVVQRGERGEREEGEGGGGRREEGGKGTHAAWRALPPPLLPPSPIGATTSRPS